MGGVCVWCPARLRCLLDVANVLFTGCGGTRANSGRKSKKRRTLSISMIKARTKSAQLHLHQEKYNHQMKKVKPLLITCTVVILARILGF